MPETETGPRREETAPAAEQTTQKTNKERLKEITDSIETGIRELFESDRYRSYLSVMSRFHKYSVNNTMLIYLQKPDATLVAGFNKWKDQFGRHVKKGEKSIQIIAPTPFLKKTQEPLLDPDTQAPMLDADGNAMYEEKTVKIPMFKPVSVFDVSQTEGKPLPQLAATLSGDVQQYEAFMDALRRSSPVPVQMETMGAGTDGYFSADQQRIAIREGMSQVQTVSAVIHEIAHSKLHNNKLPVPENAEKYDEIELFGIPGLFANERIPLDQVPPGLHRYELRGSDDDPGDPIMVERRVVVNHAGTVLTMKPLGLPETGFLRFTEDEGLNFVGGEMSVPEFINTHQKDRRTEEVEAESISYAVCQYYGIETGENSFGYIASWSKGKELKELRASLETINQTASALITDIDRNYAEVCKERGIEIKPQEAAKNVLDKPDPPLGDDEVLYLLDDSRYLHVQRCDEGYDYTLYDAATKKLIDGGRFPVESTKCHVQKTEMENAVVTASIREGFSDCKRTPVPLERLEEILAANELPDATVLQEIINTQNASYPRELPERNPGDQPPDAVIHPKALEFFGYTEDGMFPVSKDRALELFARDVPIYLIYQDKTEGLAFESEEILNHDGLYGVTKEDWEAVKANIPCRDIEKRFSDSPGDAFLIYHLNDTERELMFRSFDELDAPPSISQYHPVYVGELNEFGETGEKLEALFQTFNLHRPADYTFHSMSASDIVALKQNGVITYHYCDSVGFQPLPDFGKQENYLRNAEMAIEDDYGMIDGIINNGPKQPTVAGLEAKVNAGEAISLLDLANAVQAERKEKKSIMERLKRPAVEPRQAQKTERRRNGAEREI